MAITRLIEVVRRKEFFVTSENGLKAAFWIILLSCCCPYVSAPMALVAGKPLAQGVSLWLIVSIVSGIAILAGWVR